MTGRAPQPGGAPRVLALVDRSRHAHGVLDYATWAAFRLGARVDLLHMRDAEPGWESAEDEIATLEDAEAALELKGVADIRRVAANSGDLCAAAQAAADGAAVAVIGRRGVSSPDGATRIGGNLERVARSATSPLMVAPRRFQPVDRILLAYDDGEPARRAAALIADSPLFEGVAVAIMRIGPDSPDARQGIDAAAARLSDAGRSVELIFRDGPPASAITAQARLGGVDMIAMGAYGRSRLRSLLLGSTTTATLAGSPVPVLLLR